MESDTRQKILEASKSLFYESGYSNTTIKHIADAVGISSSVLFHYFVNKKDILAHIISERQNKLAEVVGLFSDTLSVLDTFVLRSKLYLVPASYDKRLARLLADEFNENLAVTQLGSFSSPFMSYLSSRFVKSTYENEFISLNELLKYRVFYYRGSLKEAMLSFVNGDLEFNEKSIDNHIISCFNLFFNAEIDEIQLAIAKANRIMTSISFTALEMTVLNDNISEYITSNKDFYVYNQSKVALQEDIIFLQLNDNDINNNIEWLKHKFNKAIIFTKNYKIKNFTDINQIIVTVDDFGSYVTRSCTILRNKFPHNFFATSFTESGEIIHRFDRYGIDAVKTLRHLNMYYNDDDNILTHCAFIFY